MESVKNRRGEHEDLQGRRKGLGHIKNVDQNLDLYLACFSCVRLMFAAFLRALTGVGLISSGLKSYSHKFSP